jgi:hypothetical protein
MDAINLFIRYVFVSAFQVLLAGVFTAFTVKACGILTDEKRRADPGFSLLPRV